MDGMQVVIDNVTDGAVGRSVADIVGKGGEPFFNKAGEARDLAFDGRWFLGHGEIVRPRRDFAN